VVNAKYRQKKKAQVRLCIPGNLLNVATSKTTAITESGVSPTVGLALGKDGSIFLTGTLALGFGGGPTITTQMVGDVPTGNIEGHYAFGGFFGAGVESDTPLSADDGASLQVGSGLPQIYAGIGGSLRTPFRNAGLASALFCP
jgi:hypothetical protein